ncbi:MAG: tail fiber domain-containing protein, partial [Paludibacter sp.]
MKTKIFITALCLSASLLLNAQLKVNPDGSLSTGYTGYGDLNMGSSGYTSNGTIWGKWAFEIWGENLNIWKPWPSPNNGQQNYYMFLTPSGAIGVGKVPTHLTGTCLDVNGIVYSYGSALTSDERLKTDIKPLTDKLDKLYQLNGKAYKKHALDDEIVLPDIKDEKGNVIKKYEKSKNKTPETTEFGFLAQELMAVYPELVSKDTLGYYYVNYIGLIPVLVEALKEQKIQINAMIDLANKSNSGSKKVETIVTTGLNEADALTYPVLDQNTPNPFNQSTTIGFYLPTSITGATIYVYDMNGVQLKNYSISERGKKNIIINGSEFNAGMYLYALIADGKIIDTKRMILTK